MGATTGSNSKLKTVLLALLGAFSIAIVGTCGNDTGENAGFGPGGENVEVTGVISSSVVPPDGLAQTSGETPVTCSDENFICSVTISAPDGMILSTAQLIVNLQTCGGRPVNGQSYSLGTHRVDPDEVKGVFRVTSECTASNANILDELINVFSGEADAALGADGTVKVVITHRNLFDFATSDEALAILQALGCPTLLGIQLIVALSCEGEDGPGEPVPVPGPAPPPVRPLTVKNQAETQPSEESFICDTFAEILADALDSSFCNDCEVDCNEDNTCDASGFTCNPNGCCVCSNNCGEGKPCPTDFHCDATSKCCACDDPCSKGPCPEGKICGKDGCCRASGPSCGNSKVDSGEQCDPPGQPHPNCKSGNCTASCQCPISVPSCGNSIVEAGEQCDPATPSGFPSPLCTGSENCSKSCQCEGGSECGNGTFEGKEVCDPPGSSSGKCSDPNVYCGTDCTSCDTCGDNNISGVEICDPPGSSTGKCGPGTTCDSECHSCDSTATCGNFIVEPPEECDSNGKACEGFTSTCIVAGQPGECRCHCDTPCGKTGCAKGQVCDVVTECCVIP